MIENKPVLFQSPRSGQICSNGKGDVDWSKVKEDYCFNPLDRVKFVQI